MPDVFVMRKTLIMRAWCRRRDEAGKPYNADDIWEQITRNWPSLNDADREYVFQNCAPTPVPVKKRRRRNV